MCLHFASIDKDSTEPSIFKTICTRVLSSYAVCVQHSRLWTGVPRLPQSISHINQAPLDLHAHINHMQRQIRWDNLSTLDIACWNELGGVSFTGAAASILFTDSLLLFALALVLSTNSFRAISLRSSFTRDDSLHLAASLTASMMIPGPVCSGADMLTGNSSVLSRIPVPNDSWVEEKQSSERWALEDYWELHWTRENKRRAIKSAERLFEFS